MAAALRAQVPCSTSDEWFDDMAFWDSMHGFDCFGPAGSTSGPETQGGPSFIRVYAHDASVAQTLADWQDTFGPSRGVVYGLGWYVIGPPKVIERVTGPTGRDPIRASVPAESSLTPRDDYLTTCTRYTLTEAERYVDHPGQGSSDAKDYEQLFPGVATVVHRATTAVGLPALRRVESESRPAAISRIGPEVKLACAAAYSHVGSGVESIR